MKKTTLKIVEPTITIRRANKKRRKTSLMNKALLQISREDPHLVIPTAYGQGFAPNENIIPIVKSNFSEKVLLIQLANQSQTTFTHLCKKYHKN